MISIKKGNISSVEKKSFWPKRKSEEEKGRKKEGREGERIVTHFIG